MCARSSLVIGHDQVAALGQKVTWVTASCPLSAKLGHEATKDLAFACGDDVRVHWHDDFA
jgi:hypothetical protein